MRSRSVALFEKSLNAMISAIEVYNKPDFHYREETFAILAITAWELLLKARILQLNNNSMDVILEFEQRKNKDGSLSKRSYRKRNRSGNQISIGLFKAFDDLVLKHGCPIESAVKENLSLLTEIRDNSVHLLNSDFELSKKVFEIGTACIRNYVILSSEWFGFDFGRYKMFIMPLAFVVDVPSADVIALNAQERQLIRYIEKNQESDQSDSVSDYMVTLGVDVSFKRVSGDALTAVRVTNDKSATPVRLTEEDFRKKYPFSYKALTEKLRDRYTDFSQNKKYHALRRELKKNPSLFHRRLLDPNNPNSSRMDFFSSNIIQEFDKHYTKKP